LPITADGWVTIDDGVDLVATGTRLTPGCKRNGLVSHAYLYRKLQQGKGSTPISAATCHINLPAAFQGIIKTAAAPFNML
jgi:hypothetical protein